MIVMAWGWLDKIAGMWESWNYPQDEQMKDRVGELLSDPSGKSHKNKLSFKLPPFVNSAKNIPPNTDG